MWCHGPGPFMSVTVTNDLSTRTYPKCNNIEGPIPPRYPLGAVTTGTKYFHPTIWVEWKWISQPGWVINPVPYNLVWRIRSWSIWFSAKQFVYLYWTISKLIFWNLATRKWTWIFDWVGQFWAWRDPCTSAMSHECYMYICVYIYIYIYVYIHLSLSLSPYKNMHWYISINVCICICICIYIYI